MKEEKKIFGISIWKIIAYFILYSILGYIVETIFGIITKGVWESRKSVLYGPFCEIYGLGAVIMIVSLQPFKQNTNRLFIGGFIVGSIVEYFVSLIGEFVLHVKWWDYSSMPLNIGGRICVYFSIFWGLLAIYLMTYVNPKIDRLIGYIQTKFSKKTLKSMLVFLVIFLILDNLVTCFALDMFITRKVYENDFKVANKIQIEDKYKKIYSNEKLEKWIYTFFHDKKMIRTFPNLKIQEVDGNIIYFDCYVDGIQPYYYKIFEKNLYN